MAEQLPQKDIRTPELLREVSRLYRLIVQQVNAFAIVQISETISDFIERMNGLVSSSEAILSHDTSHKTAKA